MTLFPGALTLAQLRRIAAGGATLLLDPLAAPGIAAAHDTVKRIAAGDTPVYGINTGFGRLATAQVPKDQLRQLQRNLVLSHAAGVGAPLPAPVVRLVLALKAAGLARGHSGVRPAVIDTLLALLNAEALPEIPSQGSVGASGDLAPLAHLSAALMGEGQIVHEGERKPAGSALSAAGRRPLDLEAKEGLALLNGTQVSTALALAGLFAAEDAFAAALAAGAMTTDAIKGSDTPFDARIHAVRGHRGQIDAAAALRALMAGSAIRTSHLGCGRVQDPYSVRCQPQVMGACLETLRHAAETLRIEANAVSDNPLVFPETGEILSGGNFHAEPVAIAADTLALALAETGALSERRIALLIDASLSGLPAFLVRDGGLNSGFMIAHVTAAALASENKSLAHPASVDSLPTSANQEDHVSMATFAARRLLPLAANVRAILAVELLAAAQGIDFRRPLRSSERLERVYGLVRGRAAFLEADRLMAPDIAGVADLVESGQIGTAVTDLVALPSGA